MSARNTNIGIGEAKAYMGRYYPAKWFEDALALLSHYYQIAPRRDIDTERTCAEPRKASQDPQKLLNTAGKSSILWLGSTTTTSKDISISVRRRILQMHDQKRMIQ